MHQTRSLDAVENVKPTDVERFWRSIVKAESGCWAWQGPFWPNKYGRFLVEGTSKLAHRWAYELIVGPIPDKYDIDHLCRNQPCVNPSHLEPVTHHENILRGDSLYAKNARKTHCKWGHPFDEENTVTVPSGRACRECHRQAEQRRRDKMARPHQLPKSVAVGPHKYRIVADKDHLLEGDCVGQCSASRGVIAVDATLTRTQVQDAVLHEVLHACFASMKLDEDQEEAICLNLAPNLLSVMQANPHFARWITSPKAHGPEKGMR